MHLEEPYGGNMRDYKHCFYCGNKYYPTRSDQLFCSKGCRYKYHNGGQPLILPIKGKWFWMILSGIKKEEYRERKEYWEKRFKKYFGWRYEQISDDPDDWGWHFPNNQKEIIFRNGYQKNAPVFTAVVTIIEKEGNPEWGATPGEIYYTLEIHDIFNRKNC